MEILNLLKLKNQLAAVVLLNVFPTGLAWAEEIIDLAPFTVEETGEDRALHTTLRESGRLLSGVGGESRSGVWISPDSLNAFGISSIEETFWMVAGASAQARFGVTTVPTIRGDAAETLLNGQRRGDNLFGMSPTMTMVESIEVVPGPVLPAAGLGKRTGGMVNLTTRRAVPGQGFRSLEIRLGTWLPDGGSYAMESATLDLNQPLQNGQAIRITAGYQRDETYYHRNGGRNDYRDLQIAYHLDPGGRWSLDWLVYHHDAERPQTLGVNRPWQGLIDGGRYHGGGVDPLVGQGNPPGILDPGIADPGLITGGPEMLVSIARDRVLLSQGDRGSGKSWLTQGRWKLDITPDMTLEQLFLAERVTRDKFHQFYYAEEVEQRTADAITRLSGDRENGLGRLGWQAGGHLRLEERNNRTNYWNEFAYAYDLTQGRRFSAYGQFPEYIAPGAVADGAGMPWYLPSSFFSTPETTESTVRQAALFSTANQFLGELWELALSFRADWISLEAREPDDLVPVNALEDSESLGLLSGSISLVRHFPNGTAYLTAGSYRGIAGNTVGDGLNLHPPGELHREDFKNLSKLYEAGVKWSPVDALLTSLTFYHQDRTRVEFFGPNNIKVSGSDLEIEWRLRTDTHLRVNAAYMDAHYESASPAEFGGGSLWNVYAEGAGPEGEGNGIGYIGGFFLNSLPPGDYRLPGLSNWRIGLGMRQYLGENWEFSAWGWMNGPQDGNLAGEYEIPVQTEWNAAITYKRDDLELQLLARNLFNADNWMHNGDTFFDQMLISRNLPLRLEGRLRLMF